MNKGLIAQINPDCYYVQIAIHWEGLKTTKPKELVIVNTYFCAIIERDGRWQVSTNYLSPSEGSTWRTIASDLWQEENAP